MNPATEIIGPVQTDKGAELVLPSLDRAREFARHSKAENTLRGYRADWRDFCAWCERNSQRALPESPEAVAAYIAECAGRLKVGSLQRRLNAIAEAHKATGLDSPASSGIVRNTFKGIKRTLGTAAAQKAPALTSDIRAMVDATDGGIIGLRDRALILLGFAGAFRRSELVGLDIEDCAFGKDGLTVTCHLAESCARWGLTLRSWNIASCFLRFSAITALRDLVASRSSSTRSNTRRPIVPAQWMNAFSQIEKCDMTL